MGQLWLCVQIAEAKPSYTSTNSRCVQLATMPALLNPEHISRHLTRSFSRYRLAFPPKPSKLPNLMRQVVFCDRRIYT